MSTAATNTAIATALGTEVITPTTSGKFGFHITTTAEGAAITTITVNTIEGMDAVMAIITTNQDMLAISRKEQVSRLGREACSLSERSLN